VVQNGTTFGGGNLFAGPNCPPPCHVNALMNANFTNSQDDCCQMCHETSGCVYWTFTLSGFQCKQNETKGCCWLKGQGGWYGRQPHTTGSMSGSTHHSPLPTVVPPPPPLAPDPSTTYNFLAIAVRLSACLRTRSSVSRSSAPGLLRASVVPTCLCNPNTLTAALR